jgi:hypothetical protein
MLVVIMPLKRNVIAVTRCESGMRLSFPTKTKSGPRFVITLLFVFQILMNKQGKLTPMSFTYNNVFDIAAITAFLCCYNNTGSAESS